MQKNKNILLVAVCLFCALFSSAQDFNDDARLWLYLKLDKDLNKKINAHLLIQNRFNNNVSEYSQGYVDFGFTYKVTKNIRVLSDYVYGKKRNLDRSYADLHQVFGGVILRKKVNKFVFVYRNLIQAQYKAIYSSERGGLAKIYDRNKVTIRYDINKRLGFFVAEELNLPLNLPKDPSISRSRSFIGGIYNFSKRCNLEAYFLFQRKFKINGQPNRDFIYGLTYSYSI